MTCACISKIFAATISKQPILFNTQMNSLMVSSFFVYLKSSSRTFDTFPIHVCFRNETFFIILKHLYSITDATADTTDTDGDISEGESVKNFPYPAASSD